MERHGIINILVQYALKFKGIILKLQQQTRKQQKNEQARSLRSKRIFFHEVQCFYKRQSMISNDKYNIFLMNPPYIFHPYWPFINSSNVFPFIQMNSFENYLYTSQNYIADQKIDSNPISQKKQSSTEKQLIFSDKKILDKKKLIKKVQKPLIQTKQDKNFSYRYQDKDRNIYSNILKGLLTKIREDIKFQAKCKQFIKLMNFHFQFDDFIQFIDQNFQKSKTYISPAYMKKVLIESSGSETQKFLNVLISKYLKQGFTLVLLSSQRIQKQSKILQMKKCRQLWDLLYQTDEHNEQNLKERGEMY